MKRNVPYAIILPIVVVCFAVVLMIWSMAGTSGGGASNETRVTTGAAPSQVNGGAVRAPITPSNDTAGDSARTSAGPQNKSR